MNYLWIVRFAKCVRVMLFAPDIDTAKTEARRLRPDCSDKKIVEVYRLDYLNK